MKFSTKFVQTTVIGIFILADALWHLGAINVAYGANKTVSGIVSHVAIVSGTNKRIYQIVQLNTAETYVTENEQAVSEGFEIELEIFPDLHSFKDGQITNMYPNAFEAKSVKIRSFPTLVNDVWYRRYLDGRSIRCKVDRCMSTR